MGERFVGYLRGFKDTTVLPGLKAEVETQAQLDARKERMSRARRLSDELSGLAMQPLSELFKY